MEEKRKKIPRGIRNNNPLNIRLGSKWKGLRPSQEDGSFCQFVSMEYGIRAGFYLLRKYISGYHGLTAKFNSIDLIVKRWAPPSENATQKYIDFVASRVGISSRQRFSFANRKLLCDIVDAMIVMECGQSVDRSIIESGYDLL